MKNLLFSFLLLLVAGGLSAQSLSDSKTYVDAGDVMKATASRYDLVFNPTSIGKTPYADMTLYDNFGVRLAVVHFFANNSEALGKKPFEDDKRLLHFQLSIDVMDAFRQTFDKTRKATIELNNKTKEANIIFKSFSPKLNSPGNSPKLNKVGGSAGGTSTGKSMGTSRNSNPRSGSMKLEKK